MRNYFPLMCSDTRGTGDRRDLGWNHLNSAKALLRASSVFCFSIQATSSLTAKKNLDMIVVGVFLVLSIKNVQCKYIHTQV